MTTNTPITNEIFKHHPFSLMLFKNGEEQWLIDVRDKMRKMEVALNFYADQRTYVSFIGDNDTAAIEKDEGQRAREALKP